MSTTPLEPQPRPVDDPNDPHLIGEEWVARGYESFYIPDVPPPCIIDGTPFNACTGDEH